MDREVPHFGPFLFQQGLVEGVLSLALLFQLVNRDVALSQLIGKFLDRGALLVKLHLQVATTPVQHFRGALTQVHVTLTEVVMGRFRHLCTRQLLGALLRARQGMSVYGIFLASIEQ